MYCYEYEISVVRTKCMRGRKRIEVVWEGRGMGVSIGEVFRVEVVHVKQN